MSWLLLILIVSMHGSTMKLSQPIYIEVSQRTSSLQIIPDSFFIWVTRLQCCKMLNLSFCESANIETLKQTLLYREP